MIKTGRKGSVKWDPTGAAAGAVLVSIRNFKLSMKTDKTNVTCFGDDNKVYVPGLPDISGSVAGFYNSSNLALFDAANQDTPGTLELIPNSTEAAGLSWKGLAYMDADIDTTVEGAPAVSGAFVAGGPWSFPAAA